MVDTVDVPIFSRNSIVKGRREREREREREGLGVRGKQRLKARILI